MSTNPRYDGQPLLRLLDVYVLWAIGELSQESEEGLKRMAPKLQSLFGGDGRWHHAIAQAMHMPGGIPAAIRDMWARNLKIARVNGTTLPPERFAEIFVDNNFADWAFCSARFSDLRCPSTSCRDLLPVNGDDQ